MNIFAQRFRDQLMRELTDNNRDDVGYYDYYSRIMRSTNVFCTLHQTSRPIEKTPNGKTIGEKTGEVPLFYISVKIGGKTAKTELSEFLSTVILQSFDLAQKLQHDYWTKDEETKRERKK